MKSKDLAFLLKKSSSNQWSLYDYYTLSLIQPIDTSTSNNYPSTPDNFSLILAKVSNVNLDFSDLNLGKESQLQISSIASSIQKEEKLKTENSSSGQLEHNKDSIKKSDFKITAIDSSSEVLNSPANDSFSIA
mgnify:FL=1